MKNPWFNKFKMFFAMIFLLANFSCAQKKLPVVELKIVNAQNQEISLKTEVALSEKDRTRGFMERKKIPQGTGMIFVFDRDSELSFWMKNTPHPLSIAFVAKSGEIKSMFDMTPFSLESVKSGFRVRYAIEVPQGWFKKNQIFTGCKVIFPEDLERGAE